MESLNHSHVNSAHDQRWAQQPISMLRHRGYRGKTILRHRAFQKLPLKPWVLISSAATAIVLTVTWLFLRAPVGRLWATIFQVWLEWLGLPGAVTIAQSHGTYFETVLPLVSTEAPLPDAATVMGVAVAMLGTFYISLRLPEWLVPLSYFLRVVCFIQATAVVFFAFFPHYFPHTLPTYVSMMLGSTMAFIAAIPAIMGFTFYIFDLGLARKVLLTALIMSHLVVFAPLQYLLHVYVMVKGSLIFMPLLYTIFGLLPQVCCFIAFYSWGLSSFGHDERPGPA